MVYRVTVIITHGICNNNCASYSNDVMFDDNVTPDKINKIFSDNVYTIWWKYDNTDVTGVQDE